MAEVTCSVCGETVERGPKGYALLAHSRMHRRRFRELVGRDPVAYAEVAKVLGGDRPTLPADVPTLADFE